MTPRSLFLSLLLGLYGCPTASQSPPAPEPRATQVAVTVRPVAAVSSASSNPSSSLEPSMEANPAPTAPSAEASVASAVPQASTAGSGSTSELPGLRITDLRMGVGREVRSGDVIAVRYVGRLVSGVTFDVSTNDGPMRLTIGKKQLIEGWERGLLGMRVGGKRRLVVPPELGYGDRGSPPKIPPRATLIFEIELVAIE